MISFSRVSEPLRQPRESDGPQAVNAAVGIKTGDRTFHVMRSL